MTPIIALIVFIYSTSVFEYLLKDQNTIYYYADDLFSSLILGLILVFWIYLLSTYLYLRWNENETRKIIRALRGVCLAMVGLLFYELPELYDSTFSKSYSFPSPKKIIVFMSIGLFLYIVTELLYKPRS